MADKTDILAKRTKPHSTKAEKAVIGSIMVEPKNITIVSEILANGSAFYNAAYGTIYDAMLELKKEGRIIDTITLPERLAQKDVPQEVIFSLGELIGEVPFSGRVKYYAEMVAEKATLRDLIKITEEITNDCYEDKENLTDLLETTEKKVFKIVQRRNVGEITPIDQVVMESLSIIEKAAKSTGDVTGLPSGFIDLDHKTAGFQKGNLILIAARPAMGKTSFVLSLAKDIVVRQKKAVAMFSLEMSKTELVNRMLSMDSRVDSQKFKTGQLNDADWECLIESGGNLASAQLYIDDQSTTVSEIRTKCRKLKLEKDIQLIIIDYLQLMNGNSREGRQNEVSEISRALKLLAKELDIPVIALSQLSRQVESRPDHRPMLSDLRESGAIEQDADMVIFIYRDEVYHPENTDNKNLAEIIIAKQRSGPIGSVDLRWLPEYTQFANLAR